MSDHSGRFSEMIAMRSPAFTPSDERPECDPLNAFDRFRT
jgi:hypothetical protein